MADLKFAEKRHKFVHNGQTVYEWSQAIDEVNVYITPPPGVTAAHLDCKITASRLQVGLKGNPPFLNEAFSHTVKEDESFWTMEDGVLHIQCEKVKPGESWTSALVGHEEADVMSQEEDKKAMMLQRFQKENPGFDFSGASFNGSVPDATQFMGGMKTTD